MLDRRQKSQRGDTMIEVLFAITIFSAVAVAGLTIMNQGAATAQRSLEVSLVRHEIDAQAEALRLLYDDAVAQVGLDDSTASVSTWDDVMDLRKDEASVTQFSSMVTADGCVSPASITGAFVINAMTGAVVTPSGVWRDVAPLSSRVIYSSSGAVSSVEGMWIEAARQSSAGGVPGYTDFHIRACWSTIGQDIPITLGTIVRLYEP